MLTETKGADAIFCFLVRLFAKDAVGHQQFRTNNSQNKTSKNKTETWQK